jgi:hypothetical protein
MALVSILKSDYTFFLYYLVLSADGPYESETCCIVKQTSRHVNKYIQIQDIFLTVFIMIYGSVGNRRKWIICWHWDVGTC